MERPVAVFDVDGTVFRGNLLEELVDQLIVQRVFSPTILEEARKAQIAWWQTRDRKTYDQYMGLMVTTLVENIQGVEEAEVKKAAGLIASRAHKLYRFTGDLINDSRTTHCLVAISGSTLDVVAPVVMNLGFSMAQGSVFETINGIYTGKAEAGSKNKDQTLKRMVSELGLTFKGSYGVGDTHIDIPMLELVERPIAFNPDIELFEHAFYRGWEIIEERKNVISHIQGNGRFEIDDHGFGHYYSA